MQKRIENGEQIYEKISTYQNSKKYVLKQKVKYYPPPQ